MSPFLIRASLLSLVATLAPASAWALKMERKGNRADRVTSTSQAICLAGGSSDDDWAQGWKFLLERAGGGDVVVVCDVDYCSDYKDWIFDDPKGHGFKKVNSVTTLEIASREDANSPEVERAIRNAEFVFFCGGDQAVYVDRFSGTRLSAAVEHVMNIKKAPVAGTSAGMAILAGIDYASHFDSPSDGGMVKAKDVLADPMGQFVDLDRGLLVPPYMEGVITDTHFSERDRQGRIMGFMARAVANRYPGMNYSKIKGIASDEGTAVCFDETGMARVFGVGNAFFLKGNRPVERIGRTDSAEANANCENCVKQAASAETSAGTGLKIMSSGTGLHWYGDGKAVKAYVIPGKTQGSVLFDVKNWKEPVSGGRLEYWYVDGEVGPTPRFGITPSQSGPAR